MPFDPYSAIESKIPAFLRDPFQKFVQLESASGILLLAATAAALIWANSPFAGVYHACKEFRFGGAWLSFISPKPTLEAAVNDGLMTIFFLLTGLEIKSEMLGGELASFQHAALPIAGALGGMLLPACIFLGITHGRPGAAGWGIPMATDIAFAVGILTLLGRRIPAGLKVFLVALAIIDDIGAILVIAFFYSRPPDAAALAAAAILLLALALLNRFRIENPLPYLVGGAFLWLALQRSGVHAALAGVLLAFCIPHRSQTQAEPLLPKLERILHPYVSFGILPLFALVNAGVGFSFATVHILREPLGWGILLGLCLGKPIGITLFSWLATRVRLGALPRGVDWTQMLGAGILGGIGFTMSIFIAQLGLDAPEPLDGAKLSVLCASFTSGGIGFAFLHFLSRRAVKPFKP